MALLRNISFIFAVFLGLITLAWSLRTLLLKKRSVREELTWDCGYTLPSARMQYTSAGFAQPIMKIMRAWIRPIWSSPRLQHYFPARIKLEFAATDLALTAWDKYLFRNIAKLAALSKGMQHGLLNVYIMYIVLALIITLIWQLW